MEVAHLNQKQLATRWGISDDSHGQNKLSDSKSSSKSAMDYCNTAQKNTKAACDCSDK